MPGRNKTGPLGQGPLTGRGAGFCGRNAGMPGQGNGPGCGLGFGRGRGFGMGSRWNREEFPGEAPAMPGTEVQEMRSLRQEIKELKETLIQFMQGKKAD